MSNKETGRKLVLLIKMEKLEQHNEFVMLSLRKNYTVN